MNITDLKNRKKELKLTTAQLAYLAELPVSTVSKIMTGETKNPSYITIEKIDKVLSREEMIRRIEAYKKALAEYCKSLGDSEEYNIVQFEKDYRKANNLNDAPIPFAKPVNNDNDTDGNLAVSGSNRITIDQLSMLGEDKSIELIDGKLIFSHAPGLQHQIIVQKIGESITAFIKKNKGKCRMFNVGVNVVIDEDDYSLLIPDLVIVCDEAKLTEFGINGAPDFVMEVVSKSTRRLDYNDKMHKYMHAGVREYWIVDPDKEMVTVYIAGEPMMAYVYSFNDEIPVGIYEGELKICINR